MSGKMALYSVFNTLMKEKDFYDISITEIVKSADINRNTFYYHFKDIYEFVKAFLEDEITNELKEKIKRNQFNDAFIVFVEYCESHMELMKNILTHPETLEILTKLLHDDIRLEVVDILKNYASLLNLKLPEKFFTFFSHNIMEEYMVVPKEMIFDEVEGKLLKKVFYLYVDAIPDKLLQVSKLDWDN